MVRVQKRVQVGLEVLQFFTMRAWDFKSTNYDALWPQLQEADRKLYALSNATLVFTGC